MKYLLDTNVVSELARKNRTDPQVAAWIARTGYDDMALSVLVFAEIRKGIELLSKRNPERAAALERFHDETLMRFEGRILSVTRAAADIYGRAAARTTPPVIDGLIASQAIANNLVLVTRNTRDMVRFGGRVLNPFAPTKGL